MFLHMCILCGCDFLDSLPGVGPKKAHTLIKKYRDIDKVKKGEGRGLVRSEKGEGE